LLEKDFFRRARTIFALTEHEQALIDKWIGQKRTVPGYTVLPNSIPPLPRDCSLWSLPAEPRLIYLGRFDVIKKGLDRMVAISRLLPEAEVIAYGAASRAEQKDFSRLLSSGLPGNMVFHDPVYGTDKAAALARATVYLQLSRDEGFGMAIVEAMRQGVPVAITRGCDIADVVAQQDLGLVLPDDPQHAATELQKAMAEPERLSRWSQAGREWTVKALDPALAADRTIAAYERAGQA
jgi:glycosyltransferase involved in cell wall biosynthesis